MDQQELPGASSAQTMGIVGLVTSLCCCGPFASIFCFIALSQVKKARLLYEQNPEMYIGYEKVKTAKTLSIIGLVIALISLVFLIVYFGAIIAIIAAEGGGNF